jgi:hypothetical protein
MLASSSMVFSIAVGLAAVALAVGTGFLAAKLHSASAGVLDMGVVLAWGASGFGTLRQVVAARAAAADGAGTRSTLVLLAVEAAVVGVLVVAAVMLIERAAKPPTVPTEEPKAGSWLTSLACGAAGTLVGVWLIAQTGYKGQVIGAALVGGLVGGVAAYAIEPRTRMWPVVAGCVVAAVAGPIIALVTGGNDEHLHAAVISGSVTRLALPIGFDGIAGACMGVPTGLYIAKGLLGHAGQIAEHAN